MTNSAMNCIKYAGICAAAGAAAGVAIKCAKDASCGRKRRLKYKMQHAADVMGDAFENIAYMFK